MTEVDTDHQNRTRLRWALGFMLALSIGINVFLGAKLVAMRGALSKVSGEAQVEIGDSVPTIKARAKNGESVQIGFADEERPTLLYFFSPSCDTCARNVENIKKLADLKRSAYKIVGLSLTEEGIEEYAKSHELNFPVYAGLGVETTLAYKLGRVPQTTIVSPKGRVVANWHGPFDGKLRPAIESYFQISF